MFTWMDGQGNERMTHRKPSRVQCNHDLEGMVLQVKGQLFFLGCKSRELMVTKRKAVEKKQKNDFHNWEIFRVIEFYFSNLTVINI